VNELRVGGVGVDVRNAVEGPRAFEFLELLRQAVKVNETQAGVRARRSSKHSA
jgi:hypothetical protein